jgi:hypothetical protein
MHATPTALRGRRFPGDEGLHISFYVEAVESPVKSEAEGRIVFDDQEMVEIRIPGDERTIIKTYASREYKDRFPDEYAAFKANDTIKETGTPLSQWGTLSPSQIAQLNAQNIRTVEALSSVADSNLTFMGGHELRNKAKAFLKASADAAVVEKQEAALAELRAELEALKAEKKGK